MWIELSEGEALDRLTILEIKRENSSESINRSEVEKELMCYNEINTIKNKYRIYYNLLYYVNKTIWDKTDEIKMLDVLDETFAKLSFDIFELNQQRFRMKNSINQLENSNYKEQKSYSKKNIVYEHKSSGASSYEDMLCILLYLLVTYDTVQIINSDYIDKSRIQLLLPSLKIIENVTNKIDEIELSQSMKEEFMKIIMKSF